MQFDSRRRSHEGSYGLLNILAGAGKGPLSGDLHGRDAVFEFFGKLAELSGGTMKIHDHDFLASDSHSHQHTVALFRITATRGDEFWS